MARIDKEFRLDDRILEGLKLAASNAGLPTNGYVEKLLFAHLKTVGVFSEELKPLSETRGGNRKGAGRPKKCE